MWLNRPTTGDSIENAKTRKRNRQNCFARKVTVCIIQVAKTGYLSSRPEDSIPGRTLLDTSPAGPKHLKAQSKVSPKFLNTVPSSQLACVASGSATKVHQHLSQQEGTMITAYHCYIVQHDTKFALWLIKILVVTKVKYKYRLGGGRVTHP